MVEQKLILNLKEFKDKHDKECVFKNKTVVYNFLNRSLWKKVWAYINKPSNAYACSNSNSSLSNYKFIKVSYYNKTNLL